MTPAILDSNIIIYASQPNYAWLGEFLANYRFHVSEISALEVLGYPQLSEDEKQEFSYFFNELVVTHEVTSSIIQHAIELRQAKKMSLGDAIIASTAMINQLPMITRNTADFDWIDGVVVINPFE